MSSMDNLKNSHIVGGEIKCETSLGHTMEGEVAAFDRQLNYVALSKETNMVSGKCCIQLVNLDNVKNVKVLKEGTMECDMANLPTLNFLKIEKRKQEEKERKSRSICPPSTSMDGRRLFISIRKTIDDICWEDDCILIFQHVIITPPYSVENIQLKKNDSGTKAQSALQHVKKIVDKFWRTKEATTYDLTKKMSTLGMQDTASK